MKYYRNKKELKLLKRRVDTMRYIKNDFYDKLLAVELLMEVCDFELFDKLYTHSTEVAARVEGKAKVVALLHDIVEDTPATIEDIEFMFGIRIAEAVDLLTRKKEDTYFDYIHKIATSGDKLAIEVKLADLADHLEKVDTLKPSLKKRYEKATLMLGGTI